MGLIPSCLQKNNKVGVSDTDDTEAYGTVQQSTEVDEWFESKGGVAFDVTFGSTGKTKPTQFEFMNNQKENNFEEWRVNLKILNKDFSPLGNQERMQKEKHSRAQERRHEVRVLKQIEIAHKEMDRLDKYIPLSNLQDDQQN